MATKTKVDTQPTEVQPNDSNQASDQQPDWKFSLETGDLSKHDEIKEITAPINWSASEFIEHSKGISWYIVLGLVTVVVAALIYLLTKDKISTIVVVIAAGTLAFYAARKPRLLNYSLDLSGITIQSKQFSYDSFKSFSIIDSSALPNITLLPLKRFMPSLVIYLDPSSQEEVIKIISDRLPQDLHHEDIIDKFTQRIRF